MSANLATRHLHLHNETLADYEGFCGELADAIISKDDDSVYVEPAGDFSLIPIGRDVIWKYHMAALVKGLVHDGWCEGDALPIREWLIKMFGRDTDVEVSLNGDTIFIGRCEDFAE